GLHPRSLHDALPICRRKFDRLMLGSADGVELRVLSAHGMVSHCFWMNEGALLCYLRRPDGHDGYTIVDTASGAMRPLLEGRLDGLGDGHPHVHGHCFVTDTYPDKRRDRKSTRLNSSHVKRSYAGFRVKKKNRMTAS